MTGTRQRCAAHPGRLARDRCPRCGRGRCGACVASQTAGCSACAAVVAVAGPEPARPTVAVVRAALAAFTSALVGAVIAYNYVEAQIFSIVTPALVGAVCGGLGQRVSGARGRTLWAVGVICAGYAVLSALYAFRFAGDAYGPVGRWLPPVLAALVGAVVGQLYAAPRRALKAGR